MYLLLQLMKNTFAENIVDFLKLYEPFKNVAYEDLYTIASQSEIIYLEKSKRLFKINDELHPNFYIVHSGIIHLTKINIIKYIICHLKFFI